MSQLLITPSSIKNIVEPSGEPSRNFQFWMAAVVDNLKSLLATQVPAGGIVLWPNASPLPTGWTDTGDTLTIGANTYKLLARN